MRIKLKKNCTQASSVHFLKIPSRCRGSSAVVASVALSAITDRCEINQIKATRLKFIEAHN